MALIKTDPSQKTTVIALVGVLVVALGVTVVRLKPRGTAQAAAEPRKAQTQSAPVSAASDPEGYRDRNPFERPGGMPAAPAVDSDSPQSGGSVFTGEVRNGSNRKPNPYKSAGSGSAVPMNLTPIFEAKSTGKAPPETTATRTDDAKPKPAFALLATIRGKRGLSAVIRTGESDVSVVEVGDVLQGGYKVAHLSDERAVLTVGRETIVARRPQ